MQHKTTPRRGMEGSNAAGCGCGSECMEGAGEGREGPLEPLFTSIARHERWQALTARVRRRVTNSIRYIRRQDTNVERIISADRMFRMFNHWELAEWLSRLWVV